MGYVYAFSNESMPGLIKIGMTERTPEIRLSEANLSDEFKPPTPYVIEIYKKVTNCKETEQIIHALLYDKRVNSNREFFKISIEELKNIFMGIDENSETKNEEKEYIENKKDKLISKINNDIFDVLRIFGINTIHFNGSSIEINHEEKQYNYEYHSSDNLVHIINIILSVESHVFGNDMLEFYSSHYIKQKEGSMVCYHDIISHFMNWTINSIPMDKYHKYYKKTHGYNYTYFKNLKEYLSTIYKYDSVKQSWIDVEFLDCREIKSYQTAYNILEHYKEDLLSLKKLKKECILYVGDKKFSLHKYIESKIDNIKN